MNEQERESLIRADKTPGGYTRKPDPVTGLYNPGGTRFATGAYGQCAIIMLERPEGGGFDVLMSQRAAHLAHGGKWAFFGGYLDINKGEGPLEGIYREVWEETNKILDLKAHLPKPLMPFIDYADRYNGACYCMGYLFDIRGDAARDIRAKMQKAIKDKAFDSEVSDIEIVPVDQNFAAKIAARGGIGYAHEWRFFVQAAEALGLTFDAPRPRSGAAPGTGDKPNP